MNKKQVYIVKLSNMYVNSFSGDVDDLMELKSVKLVPLLENAKIFDDEAVASVLSETIQGKCLLFEGYDD